jgi:hypothetical protein
LQHWKREDSAKIAPHSCLSVETEANQYHAISIPSNSIAQNQKSKNQKEPISITYHQLVRHISEFAHFTNPFSQIHKTFPICQIVDKHDPVNVRVEDLARICEFWASANINEFDEIWFLGTSMHVHLKGTKRAGEAAVIRKLV